MAEVLDLDILCPKKPPVKIGGKVIDVSFVPCAITFKCDDLVERMSNLDPEAVRANTEETHKAFDLGIELCATFCAVKHPEMDEKWFRENTDARQVKELTEAIRETLFDSYRSVSGGDEKNR